MSRHHRDFVTLHLSRACDVRLVWHDAFAQLRGPDLDLVGITSSSWAMCACDQYSPMKERQSIQTRNGW